MPLMLDNGSISEGVEVDLNQVWVVLIVFFPLTFSLLDLSSRM
jgi:hypothetical protein